MESPAQSASPHAAPRSSRSSRSARSLRRAALAAGAALGLVAAGRAIVACGPPPEGWEGAGRRQTLPAMEPDSGAASSGDAGAD